MSEELSDDSLLRARVRVPGHVVHRSFIAETVVLNLQTGRYHGLNPSAGRMLEVLDEVGELSDAVARLTEEYGQPRDLIEQDLVRFCRDLLDRRLIELADGATG